MTAETLNCPMCGASAATDSSRCDHCGARLATVACPSCFGMMFQGAKFCSHCGAKADRTEAVGAPPVLCPRCRADLHAVVVGNTNLRECPRCEGLWADAASLQQICVDREKQSAVLGLAAPVPTSESGALETNIRYVPCPACAKLMNRVNFANCANVVVDVCRDHGTWFDRDELRRIVEFIREGGLARAREKEIRDLEEQRRRLKAARMASAGEENERPSASGYGDRHLGISAVAAVLKALLN
jgi:Zn-finger nucleic acid-binding protein